MVDTFVFVYENRTMNHVEFALRRGEDERE
jgi:hypothetical protein